MANLFGIKPNMADTIINSCDTFLANSITHPIIFCYMEKSTACPLHFKHIITLNMNCRLQIAFHTIIIQFSLLHTFFSISLSLERESLVFQFTFMLFALFTQLFSSAKKREENFKCKYVKKKKCSIKCQNMFKISTLINDLQNILINI